MKIDPAQVSWQTMYKLLIGSVVPRPIGWVSSVDAGGRPNLAPFSFFTAAAARPPHLVFSPMVRSTDRGIKDTLQNVRATREFVVNIVTEDLAEAMNLTSTELPAGVDEFEVAGLTPAPSSAVRPPRVAESPINFECRLTHLIDLGDQPGGGSVVIGRVVQVHIREDVLLGEDKIDLSALRPIGRLAGADYCRVTDLFQMTRPPSQVPPAS